MLVRFLVDDEFRYSSPPDKTSQATPRD